MINYTGIPAPKFSTHGNELDYYVEGHNDTYDMITLGYAMVYNHAPEQDGIMLRKIHVPGVSKVHMKELSGMSHDVHYVSNWAIFPGDQIFNFYGNMWFQSRKMPEVSTRRQINRDVVHIDDIFSGPGRIPGCATGLTIIKNNILVATKDIQRGEVIEVARSLLLPEKSQYGAGLIEKFLWWKRPISNRQRRRNEKQAKVNNVMPMKLPKMEPYNISHSYTLLLLGNGALYQGISRGLKVSDVNVLYDWWDISSMISAQNNNDDESFDVAVDGLGSNKYSHRKLDKYNLRTKNGILCDTRMLVSFVAARNITAGEALIVNTRTDRKNRHRYPLKSFTWPCM